MQETTTAQQGSQAPLRAQGGEFQFRARLSLAPLYDQEDMQRIEETRVLPEQSHLCMTKMGAKL